MKKYEWGLPWGLSGKESACQRRRHGFDPWSGMTPHAVEQLSLSTTTTEPVSQRPGSETREATAVRSLCTEDSSTACCNWRKVCTATRLGTVKNR